MSNIINGRIITSIIHINFFRLVAKKKENYRKMLEECKGIELDSSWKEIKKIIKDDPR